MIYNVEFKVKNKSEYNPFGVFDVLSINFANLMRQGAWKQIAREKNDYCILSDMKNVGTCFRIFLEELFNGTNSFEQAFATQGKLVMLLAEIGKCKAIGKSGGNLWYIRRAQEYINHHFVFNIRIDEIAKFVGVSKAYLQRIYRAYTGTTILKAINTIRVERAKQMLMSSNLSVKQVGEQSGFRNNQHFIYEFKETTGVTPSEYRKRLQYKSYNHESKFHESNVFVDA